jgi:drug/metabolite transporter (DMT)-like permease
MAEMEYSARRRHLLGYGACALASTLWGTGFYCGRLALNEMPVEWMVLCRFLFACLGMIPILAWHRQSLRMTPGNLRLLLATAALGIPIQFLLQFHGLARTTVSHASLMVGAMPVMVAASAAIFAGERLDWFGWLALFGSTLGAALVVLGGQRSTAAHGGPSLLGDLLVLASLVTALGWILLSKKLMEALTPQVVTAGTILSGTVMLAIWVLGHRLLPFCLPASWLNRFGLDAGIQPFPLTHISLVAWSALAFSGFFCTAATTLLWNWGIHYVPASRAGALMNIEPALGSVLGVELLGEHLGPYAWIGGVLILSAALILTLRDRRPERAVSPE